MRTTLRLDDDVLAAVRSLARAQGRSLGIVISDLVRRGLAPAVRAGEGLEESPGGFPTFVPPPGARPLTGEAVRAVLDGET